MSGADNAWTADRRVELEHLRAENVALAFRLRDVTAERDRLRRGHCGCAWCCVGVDPEKRGEAHKRTCQPRALDTPEKDR